MNRIYKVIFNKATQTCTATGENAKGQGKASTVGSSRTYSNVAAAQFINTVKLK